MAHTHYEHEPAHEHDVEYVERTGAGFGAGLLIALATLIILAAIAFAVLWSRPWSNGSGGGGANQPGIGDNSGGGQQGGSGSGEQPGGGGGGQQGGQ
ncbi:MAG TPA: hypothetical protein VFC53_11010 [Dehalococcoidia bacterium]|nr:hypothetical protein [Dehalococcoidia bacterium]